LAAFFGVVLLALGVLAAGDGWHRQLHAAGGKPVGDADCPLCLLSTGGCDAPPAAVAVPTPSAVALPALVVRNLDFVSARPGSWNASRGPPVASTSVA
jgi:hypothetical protein